MDINSKIVSVAANYLGYQEIRGNKGFHDEEFERKMRAVGFKDGFAWCALWGELVWREAYAQENSLIESDLCKLFSASAVQTFKNFRNDKKYTISKEPEVGALVVWQYRKDGVDTWRGHLGIVESYTGNSFRTMEGNTSDKVGDREGYTVARKVYKKTADKRHTGLNLIGFVFPLEP